MPEKKQSQNIQQTAIGDGNVQVAGENNTVTVNQTIIQKFFNIFKSDAETVDQRNRRIMLGHVENFWVKGILEKSLHGAALLELGIKEDPDALTYPWAIKREATKETLPADKSMLEIFQEIGMGRSLLILGAPGSGKTTMLLELTRQLIERARQDVTEPIPVVFNLSSWTEKLTFADWLARELNVIYTIPRKLAPTWVKENKMLLLLDGLDEVRQESRDKCVDAINQFRKENGLTSIAICSRIQDYAELKTRLSFDGAIEIQPLTSIQVNEYFKSFGKGLAGIRQVLEKDIVLREMAETPLFLSIMTLAYRDTYSKDILVSENLDIQRKRLFDTYVERMFERSERSKNEQFKKQNVLHWLSWLAQNMIEYRVVPYLLENMQPYWLRPGKQEKIYILVFALSYGLILSFLPGGLLGILIGWYIGETDYTLVDGLIGWLVLGLMIFGIVFCEKSNHYRYTYIDTIDTLALDWQAVKRGFLSVVYLKEHGFWKMLPMSFLSGLIIGLIGGNLPNGLFLGVSFVLVAFMTMQLANGLRRGLMRSPIGETIFPGQILSLTIRNYFIKASVWVLPVGLFLGLYLGFVYGSTVGTSVGLIVGVVFGLSMGLRDIGIAVIQHYCLRMTLSINNLFPWKLIPFLNHCTDLIFLRRVGGGYIFVHRLLMEHFADMYTADEK